MPIHHNYSLIDVLYPALGRQKLGVPATTDDLPEGTVNKYAGPATGPVPTNTDQLPEGTHNLYWTQARFDHALEQVPQPLPVGGQVEVDFGAAIAVNSGTFAVADGRVAANSRISCWLAGVAPASRDLDDILSEEPLKLVAVPGPGSFELTVEQPHGCLNDGYIIEYLVSTP